MLKRAWPGPRGSDWFLCIRRRRQNENYAFFTSWTYPGRQHCNASGKLNGGKNPPRDGFINDVPEFDGNSHEVPEPGVLGLLGVGLVGIILGRRRRAVLAD